MLIVHLYVSYAYVNLCHFFSSSWRRGLAVASVCDSFNIYRASGGPAPRISSKERNCTLLGTEMSYNRWYFVC